MNPPIDDRAGCTGSVRLARDEPAAQADDAPADDRVPAAPVH